jgi:hypothetical protein
MNEAFERIRSFSWKGWTLLVLVALAVLVTLFYAEEDLRGWYAWHHFKKQWEAKGERFDRQSIVPPKVPDDQNFALTPVVATSYGQMLTHDAKAIPPKNRNPNFVNRLQMSVIHEGDNAPAVGNWAKATETDLTPWQTYYRALASKRNEFPIAREPQTPAQDVLLALSKYDSTIEELREAAKLPDSRFPLEYDKDNPAEILLPHLAAMKRCSQVLQLRAIAELQNGQTDQALADVKLLLRLTEAIRTEPILISHLVRIAMLQIGLQPVYEGLAEHKWSDSQLAELDTEFAKLDFLADYKLTMRGEMILFQGGIFDYLRRHPAELLNLSGSDNPSPSRGLAGLLLRLVPRGWFYKNQLNCARPMVEFFVPLADVDQQTVSPSKARKADAAVKAQTRHASTFNIIESMMLPALGSSARRFAYGQNSANLARTAIALERYRLDHGQYPASLDALAPLFGEKTLHDVISGEPLHYDVNAYGHFVLYSVGWNETDDGGKVVSQKGSAAPVDINLGDWVWRYPQN